MGRLVGEGSFCRQAECLIGHVVTHLHRCVSTNRSYKTSRYGNNTVMLIVLKLYLHELYFD